MDYFQGYLPLQNRYRALEDRHWGTWKRIYRKTYHFQCFSNRTERAGAGGWGGWGLQTVSKQSGRTFLHPAAAAVAMAVGPQPTTIVL